MRKIIFENEEFYHIFNRGIEKRPIFSDIYDYQRFFQSMEEFNTVQPIGSIYENSFQKNHSLKSGISNHRPLVHFIAYCLNPNHYHLILQQTTERGIEKFMHRLGIGYTKYFNEKRKRGGHLFQGPFKAVHIEDNQHLLYLSVYVNLNFRVHRLGNSVSKSSWDEYRKDTKNGFCKKEIILDQFRSVKEYIDFSRTALDVALNRKDIERLFLEEV